MNRSYILGNSRYIMHSFLPRVELLLKKVVVTNFDFNIDLIFVSFESVPWLLRKKVHRSTQFLEGCINWSELDEVWVKNEQSVMTEIESPRSHGSPVSTRTKCQRLHIKIKTVIFLTSLHYSEKDETQNVTHSRFFVAFSI